MTRPIPRALEFHTERPAARAWETAVDACVDAARRRGAELRGQVSATHRGQAPLCVELGRRDAERTQLWLVGVRGHHALAGAELARWYIDHGPAGDDLRVVIVLGVDADASRVGSPVSRGGVDLDRNWIDFGHPSAGSADEGHEHAAHDRDYDRVHAALVYAPLEGPERRHADAALRDLAAPRWSAANTGSALAALVDRGQSRHPDGLAYRGQRQAPLRRELGRWWGAEGAPSLPVGGELTIWTVEGGAEGWGRVDASRAPPAGSLGRHLAARLHAPDAGRRAEARMLDLGTGEGPAAGLECLRDEAICRLGLAREPEACARVRHATLGQFGPGEDPASRRAFRARIDQGLSALLLR